MAQKIPASYTVERGMAYAGQIADTSAYNIDGACVAHGNLGVGVAVTLGEVDPVDGHKVVAPVGGGEYPLFGVTIMSHAYSPEGFYEDAMAVNVMTSGRVWVLADKDLTAADVKFGTKVNFDAEGKVSKTGVISTDYLFMGQILPAGADFKIVQVQVLQSARGAKVGG